MRTITLKIPDEMDEQLEAVASQRHESKSAVVREAVTHLLAKESVNPAVAWTKKFRGILAGDDVSEDDRMNHIIAKHVH